MLKTRTLTALAGIPVLLFFAYLGGYWYGALLLAISLVGVKEYFALVRKGGWNPFDMAGYLFIPLGLFAVFQGNLLLIIILWMLFFASLSLFPIFSSGKVKYWESAVTFWGIVYNGGPAGFLLSIRFMEDGFILTIFLFLAIWASDVFAYIVGGKLGKRLLAPKISPKKTVEGAVAGLVGSTLAGFLLMFFAPLPYIEWPQGALLGFLCGLSGMLGDLSQSAMKRSVGAKDSGDLLPGHGGILDRFDSLFFAAPFFYIYLHYLTMV